MIALTADFQFDVYSRLSTPHPTGVSSRLVDLLDCWRWVEKTAVKEGASTLVVAGDLFNNRTVIDLTVADLFCRAAAVTAQRLKIKIIPGNHDSHLRTPAINSVQMLRGIADVYETPTVSDGIGYVPWTDDLTAFRKGVDAVSSSGAEVLVSHMLVEGCVPVGGIPVEYLSPKKFKRVFLGDVHDPVVHPDYPRVQYIGSPLQIDHRDAGRLRGFTLYDPTNDHVDFIENTVSPRFHVVTAAAQVAKVKKADFVKVKIDDAAEADKVTAAAKVKSGWVESTTVQVDSDAARLNLTGASKQDEVLRRYARYMLPDATPDDIEALVAEGLLILEAAKE